MRTELQELCRVIRGIYGDGFVALHRPVFAGRETTMLAACIASNFVSSAGAQVGEFERTVAAFAGAGHGVAVVNGTAALHAALLLAGVRPGDEVITQPLTFVATCNAIAYAGARAVFVDVDEDTMGLSPSALRAWLRASTRPGPDGPVNARTGARVAACVPMHTFGLPARIAEIAAICAEFAVPLIEDAAESLGSRARGRHTGLFGRVGTLSFNGNKIITTGGGGMLLTDDADLAAEAKHLTTTAKQPHAWAFVHDRIGYNYRLPNLNAALGCAQMERLPAMLEAKRAVAARYAAFAAQTGLRHARAREGDQPNHWLNAFILNDRDERDAFLAATNAQGIMTRPVWTLMTRLDMFRGCESDGGRTAAWLEERVVNVPSSVPDGALEALAS